MVADGYKQTEYGLIPNDWVDTEFQNALDGFSSGMTPYRGNPEYYKGAVKWITSGELNYNTVFDTIEHISLDAVKKTNLKILPKGTFLMAITGLEAAGTRGSCAIVGSEATTNQSCMAIFPTNKLSIDYFYHFYVKYGNLLAFKYCQGTKQQSYTAKIVKVLPIVYPSDKKEQQAIATALSDTDELINSLEKLISKKEAIKTGTMQELLTGKKRLDGFSGEWEEKFIKEFTDGTAGGTPSTKVSSYWGGNIRWMSSGELNDKVIFDVEGRITEEGLNNSSTKMIPENCILIGLAGQGKTRGTVAINRVKLCTNQSIAAIYPSDKYVSEYLYYNMDSRYEELRAMSTGDGGRGGLNLTILRSFKVPFPSKEEQKAIAQILSDIDNDIEALKTKLSKVKAIKEGMMQELLTGKTRLI